jgi:prepilin-type N-terminal cleavage/methylation domain-containing protein
MTSSSRSLSSASCSHPRKSSAFTLIELLVVIAIIAILAGLGFAGMKGAMDAGKKAQARNDVSQIASAVKAHVLEFGRLPEKGTLMATLTGNNPKKIVFFEAKNAVKGKGGLQGQNMMDPWGEAYKITLDDNYDNKTKGELSGVEHLTTVVVETMAPDKKVISNVQ